MLRKISLILFLLCFETLIIKAQSVDLNKPGIGIGPQLGFYKTSGADNATLMYGLALRVKLTPALGVEGSINYRQEEYGNGFLTVRSWPVMVTGLLYPIPLAYGAIGAGWYNTTFDYSKSNLTLVELEDQTKQLFGWHIGGGVELPIGSSARLTGDIRYVFLDYKVDQLNETEVEDIKSNFYAITVGLLFGF